MSPNQQIIIKLIEIQEDIKDIKLKMSDYVTKDEFYNRTDEMMVIIKRLDQESVFNTQRLGRVEKKLSLI